MPQPKPTGGKGKDIKILCATLDFIVNANLDIAIEEKEKGNTKEANEALDTADQAGKDYVKWGCGKSARVHKRIAKLSRELKSGRRSSRR